MLALLAFACFPAFAQAGCDASCLEYRIDHDEIPESGVKNGQHPKSPGVTKPSPTPDKPAGGGDDAESPRTESEGEGEAKHATDAGGGGGAGGNGRGKGGSPPSRIAVSPGEPAPGPTGARTGPSAASITHSGGSSPVLAILVAVAALAALSIASVVYRGRRRMSVG